MADQRARLARSRRGARWLPEGGAGRAGWLAAALLLALVVTLGVALLTRPIRREALPQDLDALRPDLLALHQGPDPCLRWGSAPPLSDDDVSTFLRDWEASFTADLHLLLPWVAALRVRNARVQAAHHDGAPEEEARRAALARLGGLDRLRLRLRPGEARVEELMPFLQRFEARAARLAQDERRAGRLWGRLSGAERAAAEALIERWGARLSTPGAQGSLLDEVARRVTLERLGALEEGVRAWMGHYGAPPRHFAELLTWLQNTRRLPAALARAQERDGSLRDGWLRPMTYYPIGARGYFLSSEGPSEATDADDIARERR